ncbi:hypothetical protein I549_3380 [Mycobacterium avium subsp. avium 2285 (R)]|nr:hypothetical protein I549_3380 [Mycobacterium avium subsp. avium 2285 (R)]
MAGAVVLLGSALAWLVAGLAAAGRWPLPALVPATLVFGLLVGAIVRGTAAPAAGANRPVARGAVAAAVGVVVGELAALVILSGPIDQRLDEQASRTADSAPAVVTASATLRQAEEARAALDGAVAQARDRQDRALVVARCEYHPTPGCPQTRITGVPGPGPETRTANELLADAQRELDEALAARDSRAPELDAAVSRAQRAVADARRAAMADAGRAGRALDRDERRHRRQRRSIDLAAVDDRGLRAAVPDAPDPGAVARGDESRSPRRGARARRERAELDADTAIAIKRAEVRREAEIMWAEHQLTQSRLAIEAQTEIDREHQRRRVLDAVADPPSPRAFEPTSELTSELTSEPARDDVYLPIAAEAEAASRAITQAPQPRVECDPGPQQLPSSPPPNDAVEQDWSTPLIPSIPDATKAAARWIRPLVPPLVARMMDTTTHRLTHPLRTARQVFEGVVEETEEITFALRRTRKVTVNSQATQTASADPTEDTESRTESRAAGRISSPPRRSNRDRGRTGG